MSEDSYTIKIGKKEIVLDPTNMSFNEVSLSEFFQKSAGYYDNFGRALADLEGLHQMRKMEYDRVSSEKFDKYKTEGGCSDKLAAARTDSDEEVLEARKGMISAMRNVNLVKNHLRAWDKAHDNALSTGHMLRKEMDKLGASVKDTTEQELGEVFGK